MKTLAAAAVACAAMAAVPGAEAARPMTIQDLLTAVRVTDPQLSPDGRLVAFVRTTTDLSTGKRNADIWVVPADGSAPPKALITGDKSETTPRWTPDGRQLLFISTRDGDPQVFVAGADGSGVRRVTALSAGVQEPLIVAPDGQSIAFVADVFTGCADDACNKARAEALEKNPVKARVLDHLLYRHWVEWRNGVRHHVFVADLKGGAPRDVTPGDHDSPPVMQEDGAIAFSPDGRALAFVSNREGADAEAWTTNHDIWIVPSSGGEPKQLTSNPASDLQPLFTKDGRSVIVRAQRRPGFESDRFYLDVYDRATGTKRTVFETPDLSVSDFTISPDGQTIYFTAADHGTDNLYRVPVAGGTPAEVAKGGAIGAVNAGADALVFARAAMTAPAELYRLAPGGGAAQPLTHENDGWRSDVAMNPPESMTVPGAGGTPVQCWVIKPPSFDPARKYPVVFLIHGGPQGEWGDAWSARWNPELWAAQGWVIAAPNPRGSFGFGQRFVDEISQDWGGKVMQDLDAVFDAVGKLPYVDANRMGIAGASYGGYAVDWIIGHTSRFKVAVTHDGVFNLESMALATEELWFTDWEFGGAPWTDKARANLAKWSPHRYAQNIRTPTLVITNELDFRVPVDQGLQLFTALRRNGVPSKAIVFPDEGHWVLKPLNSQFWHESVFAWIKQYLEGTSTTASRE